MTRVDLKITRNYKTSVQRLYKAEGQALVAAQYFWGNYDMNEDSQVDREQVKNGAIVTYTLAGLEVVLSKVSTPNHTASILVDNLIEMRVENFPGSAQGGTSSGHANPDIRGWKEIQ